MKLEINVKQARFELVQVNQEIQSRRKNGAETVDLEVKQSQISKVARKEINGNEISVVKIFQFTEARRQSHCHLASHVEIQLK